MLFKRSYAPEIMDDFTILDERIDEALQELRIINKFLGGNSVTRSGLKKMLPENRLEKINVLDIGGGASDILLSLKDNVQRQIVTLDINKRTCLYTKMNKPQLYVVCGDANNLPFKERSFDLVHASLFLHHFTEEQIETLCRNFLKVSRYGIVINDLRRSLFAWLGIKVLTFLFSKSAMVKNDAPLSVKRGFIKQELKKIFSEVRNKSLIIKRKWAFRWLVILYK